MTEYLTKGIRPDRPKAPKWKCKGCGREFKTKIAAQAAARVGCPNCGKKDIEETK